MIYAGRSDPIPISNADAMDRVGVVAEVPIGESLQPGQSGVGGRGSGRMDVKDAAVGAIAGRRG